MTKILLAEDDDLLRAMTRTILEINGYQVFAYANGQLASEAFPLIQPDLVVSDINMPILNGYELLDAVRARPEGVVVPFLFLSANAERDDVTAARRLGADDYLFKPYEPDELITAVKARLDRRHLHELFDSHQAHLQTVILLANLIEARDAYTRGHVKRVQDYAIELAHHLDWSPAALACLEFGALLHDIGKIIIPEAVLNKPSDLTPDELEIIRRHTTAGAHIIDGVTHLREARPYILYHHEKWDGTGYPEGLRAEDIPIQGRLLAIADVYDALTSDRPYHKGIPFPAAISILRRASALHFDPHMVEVFCQIQESKLSPL